MEKRLDGVCRDMLQDRRKTRFSGSIAKLSRQGRKDGGHSQKSKELGTVSSRKERIDKEYSRLHTLLIGLRPNIVFIPLVKDCLTCTAG